MSVKLSSYVWDACAVNGVKGTKLLIMARLADFSNDDGISWYGIDTIARQIGAGRSTVITLIGELEKSGWLTRKSRRQGQRNTSNLYTLNVEKLRKASDAAYRHSSKSEPSESEPSESERTEKRKKAVSHGSESGPDPSVNSTTDPSGNSKPSCPVATQPDPEVVITDLAKQALSHLNLTTGSRFQVCKTSLEHIRARLREGFTPEELTLVVDYSAEKWGKDLKMAGYLRPTTLFLPSKFPGYLQSATKWDAAGRPKCVDGKWVMAGAGDSSFKSSYSDVDYSGVPRGFRS